MAELSSSSSSDYPSIDPNTFDLIVYGTGLPESLLAAAAAFAGKSVLHLDPNPFYGSHFSSLHLSSFLSSPPPPSSSPSPSLSNSSYSAVPLQPRCLYSEIETSGSPPEPSRSFLLDLAGPRALYCSDDTVDLLLRSGASHHVEFKSVDSSLIYWEERLCSVPDSRQAIFKDRTLGLTEKSQMMKFLKLVQSHITDQEGSVKISDEELELPFLEFLKKQPLPPKIRAIVLYAIAMADYDQDDELCKKVITTKEGINSIAFYTSSIGRFTNAVGAFIYPMYGHGELPQAFCRCAAVKGALYVLRMPVVSLLVDKENDKYKGVRLVSGQEIFSTNLVMDPSNHAPNLNIISPKSNGFVARGVCISSCSTQPDSSNILLIFPPKSLYPEQRTTVRALQLSGNVAVCPPGLYVLYLSTPCINNDHLLGKEYINSAIKALFTTTTTTTTDTPEFSEDETNDKPALLWSCLFVQELTQASFDDAISVCPMPDENLDYRNILESTKMVFERMYPDEEYIPNILEQDNIDDGDDATLD